MSLVLTISTAWATITVQEYWRIGDDDPWAIAGGMATNATDSVGVYNLNVVGQATYSADVSAAAFAHTGSALSVSFTNSAFATNSVISTVQDNFGIEAWVKPVSLSGNPVLVYNGNTGTSGWGFMINNGNYQGLFGGVTFLGAGVATPNVWTHVALVRNNGVATLYTNGVAAGTTSTSTPNVPAGNFAVADAPPSQGVQTFNGLVDEVRFFTFTAGQFTTNDLLFYSTPPTALGTHNLLAGPGAGSNSVVLSVNPTTSSWTATANASWLHLSAGYQSGTGSTNVIFNYDANTGETRSGTLTIGGQLLTVTQAGSTYVAASPLTTLVPSGLYGPHGVAVDGVGNVYIADTYNNAVKEWLVASNTVTTLPISGLNNPDGVAVDGAGNVYVSDVNYVRKWQAASNIVTTLTSPTTTPVGVDEPYALALDVAGDIYIADSYNDRIDKWWASNGNITVLVSGGTTQYGYYGVATDMAGDNVYFTDKVGNMIQKWSSASGAVTTVVSSGLNRPSGVAVDGSGNLYIADSANGAIEEWSAASGTLTTLVSYASGLGYPFDVAVDGTGNLYIADISTSVYELPYAFVNPTPLTVGAGAGSDALPAVLPATENLTGPFAPVSDAPWLTITGVTNGVVSFSFTSNSNGLSYELPRTANITLLGHSIAVTQSGALVDTTNLLVGPAMGNNSVALEVVPATNAWTATANAAWLHLSAANQSGNGCTNVIFTYDANAGTTRSGTLTIAGQTVTVTQAGSAYVAARSLTTLVSSGLNNPDGVAVDGTGNVYIADTYNNAIKEWLVASNTVTTLVSSGLYDPTSVAVDEAGNVYISDFSNSAVKKWQVASNTLITLATVNSTPVGVGNSTALALDVAGDIYIADGSYDRIAKWRAVNSSVTAVVSATGNARYYGVATDMGGDNVYFTDNTGGSLQKWSAASGTVTAVVPSGLSGPQGVAADGSGNLYIADAANSTIAKWSAASGTPATLLSVPIPNGVAVDGAGNLYIAAGNNAIYELPYAFVNSAPLAEGAGAGEDFLPPVLPTTENLLSPFAPVSDSPWLTILGATNGVVSFSFTANPSVNDTIRTANITLLGQTIPVTQGAAAYTLSTNALTETATAGSDQVVLTVSPTNGIWTATTNVNWLHLSMANQSGIGSATITFTFDINPGPTRIGTLTIAGQIVTVTQESITPPVLTDMTVLGNGAFQFAFNSISNATFTVWSATNLTLPFTNWTMAGPASNAGLGLFQFISPPATNDSQRFFRVSSP